MSDLPCTAGFGPQELTPEHFAAVAADTGFDFSDGYKYVSEHARHTSDNAYEGAAEAIAFVKCFARGCEDPIWFSGCLFWILDRYPREAILVQTDKRGYNILHYLLGLLQENPQMQKRLGAGFLQHCTQSEVVALLTAKDHNGMTPMEFLPRTWVDVFPPTRQWTDSFPAYVIMRHAHVRKSIEGAWNQIPPTEPVPTCFSPAKTARPW